MTHILLVADRMTRAARTGIDRYYDKLIKWLPRLAPEWDFTVVSFGEADQTLAGAAPNIRHCGLPVSRRDFMLRAFSGLNPLAAWTAQADVVHVMMPLPVRAQKPLLMTVFDMTPLQMPELYPFHSRWIFRHSIRLLNRQNSHFTTISQQVGADLRQFFSIPDHHIHPILLGADEDFRVPDDMTRAKVVVKKYRLPDRYFLYIGSMHKRKNLATALEAYALYRRHSSATVRLVLAGRMEMGGDTLKQKISEYGLDDAVVLPGYIEDEDLPLLMANAVALLYPSIYEGFGLPPIEAMACGTPVIAAHSGSIPEVTGGHAVLCDPFDAPCFANMMTRLSSDSELRTSLMDGAREWAGRFTWRSTAERTLELYKRLL
jgi:glycosyltransferase involved in cell wall biosynthesis